MMSFCCPALMEVQGVPALPSVLFQVLCEVEVQTHGTGQGQDCWGRAWHSTASAASCLVDQAGHQPEGHSDPHDDHLKDEFLTVSAQGALEA